MFITCNMIGYNNMHMFPRPTLYQHRLIVYIMRLSFLRNLFYCYFIFSVHCPFISRVLHLMVFLVVFQEQKI